MRHREVAAVVDATPEAVWALIAEPARWPAWGPSITAVSCPDVTLRTGTRGRVRTVLGIWLPFTVTEVDPGRRWGWRIGPVAATGHRVEEVGDGRTRVVFEVPGWAAPYTLVCRRALERIAVVAGTR
jgi:uncharacterized protein YndB with AHSA1/START domain